MKITAMKFCLFFFPNREISKNVISVKIWKDCSGNLKI